LDIPDASDVTGAAYYLRRGFSTRECRKRIDLKVVIGNEERTTTFEELFKWMGFGEPSYAITDLLDAIEWVESRGDPNAVCPDECCVGAYQLTESYVDDANMILRKWKKQIYDQIEATGVKGLGGWFVPYTYEDRFNREHSRDMTHAYLLYYDPSHAGNDFEAMARIHNGGPEGYRNDPQWFVRNRGYTVQEAVNKIVNSQEYWFKVKARMESVK
jgi:hypothetical protein